MSIHSVIISSKGDDAIWGKKHRFEILDFWKDWTILLRHKYLKIQTRVCIMSYINFYWIISTFFQCGQINVQTSLITRRAQLFSWFLLMYTNIFYLVFQFVIQVNWMHLKMSKFYIFLKAFLKAIINKFRYSYLSL